MSLRRKWTDGTWRCLRQSSYSSACRVCLHCVRGWAGGLVRARVCTCAWVHGHWVQCTGIWVWELSSQRHPSGKKYTNARDPLGQIRHIKQPVQGGAGRWEQRQCPPVMCMPCDTKLTMSATENCIWAVDARCISVPFRAVDSVKPCGSPAACCRGCPPPQRCGWAGWAVWEGLVVGWTPHPGGRGQKGNSKATLQPPILRPSVGRANVHVWCRIGGGEPDQSSS